MTDGNMTANSHRGHESNVVKTEMHRRQNNLGCQQISRQEITLPTKSKRRTDQQSRKTSNPTTAGKTTLLTNQVTQRHTPKWDDQHATETKNHTFKAKVNFMENGNPPE
jgi:hypothetical protein